MKRKDHKNDPENDAAGGGGVTRASPFRLLRDKNVKDEDA